MPNKRFALKYNVTALDENRGEIMIYSDISPYSWGDESVTARDFDKRLKDLGDVDEITIRINSPGGAVNEAVAIRTALMKHQAKKTIDIEGECCSAATIIACLPGAHVRMAKGGDYMIHRASWLAWGHADAMYAAYQSLTNTDNAIADMYAERTGMTKEKCLELMTAETWYSAETAMEAGFVDEIITGGDEELPIVACAFGREEAEQLIRTCYAHAPESAIKNACAKNAAAQDHQSVSNEQSAVAAEDSTENKNEGVTTVDVKEATAEQLQTENPELMQTITQQAIAAERERIRRIDRVTPKGAKFAEMAKKAKEAGTSVEDYLAQVVEAQEKAGDEYLEARAKETAKAGSVGGGDTKDHDGDDTQAKSDKLAKELAELANGMKATHTELA